jgi:hypothetical protein
MLLLALMELAKMVAINSSSSAPSMLPLSNCLHVCLMDQDPLMKYLTVADNNPHIFF